MQCDRCTGEALTKAGRTAAVVSSGLELSAASGSPRGRRRPSAATAFPDEIIALAVRCFLRFRLLAAGLDEFGKLVSADGPA